MTYGGFTYGGAPYGSSAPSSAPVTVTLAPAVVDVVAPVVDAATAEILVGLQPAVVEVVAPTTTVKVGTRLDLAPAVVEVVGATVNVISAEGVNLQPAIVQLVAPTIIIPDLVALQPAVVEIVAPRIPRRAVIGAWTADDASSTALACEVQIEPDLRWDDPPIEAGWQPIRTNRVTWSSIEVDTDTGRPVTPTTVSVPLAPAVLELVGALAEF